MNTKNNQLFILGEILEISSPTTGENGSTGQAWTKQEFIIQTDEKYPKQIALTVWGDNGIWLSRCIVGDLVKCQINIQSKKSGERWFTEVAAWRIDVDVVAMKSRIAQGNTYKNPEAGVTMADLNNQQNPF
jgi:hypothetical protein